MKSSSEQSQQFYVDSVLSKKIHSLRFLLIVFIVLTHNVVIDKGINFENGTQNFPIPYYVSLIRDIVKTAISFTVSMFFLISSLLLFSKEISFVDNIKKKSQTILAPYFLWIILELLLLFILQNISFTKTYIVTYVLKNFSVWDWLGAFTGKSGIFAINGGLPLNGAFWFLRDLFILNVFFLVIKKIIDAFPAGTFIVLFMIWIGNINLYIFDATSLFFFAMGYYIVKYNIDHRKLDNIRMYDICIMFSLTICARLFLGNAKIPAVGYINVLVGILFFAKCSSYLIANEKLFQILLALEKQQFFVYAGQNFLITALIKLSPKIMPMSGAWMLAHYFGISILCVMLLVAIGMICRKLTPKIFAILTGGR
jgi:hypothetical protein